MAKKKNKKSNIPQQVTFLWKGLNRRGQKINGEIVADNLSAAKVALRQQGVTPSNIKKKPKEIVLFAPSVKSKDISVFTRQLSTMLAAGVPLMQSIEMIGKGSDNPAVRELLGAVSIDVQSGLPLNEALRKHPRQFDDLYCDLVLSGEQSGALEGIYDRIATYKEKSEALKSKIKKAMTYPIAVLTIAAVVTAVLLVYVVPQFEDIFAGFGAELPAFTQMVIAMSDTLQEQGGKVLIAMFLGAYGFKKLHQSSPLFRDKVDVLLLKMPIFGGILNKASLARFTRTLATTFAAGVPLVEALDSAAGASGNAVYRKAILNIKSEVSAGMQMNMAMRNTGLFPDMVTQMVHIGEESGAIDDMLNKVANVYEQEVDDAVDGLSALIEPLIMAVLGVLIGGLILAMYLPIFQMGDVM